MFWGSKSNAAREITIIIIWEFVQQEQITHLVPAYVIPPPISRGLYVTTEERSLAASPILLLPLSLYIAFSISQRI